MHRAWLALVVLTTIALTGTLQGECAGPSGDSSDAADVWLISTRHLPCDACPQTALPEFRRLSPSGDWIEADQATFVRGDPASTPTVFFIHGNRYDAGDAVENGLTFREELKCLTPGARFRFVIWSWPADRIARRNRPDLLVKHARSQQEAVYVARVLDRMSPQTPVSLVGFSYGAQTIVGAFRLLAGGCYAGCMLQRRGQPRRAPWSAVLVASALEETALASDDEAISPLAPLDRVLVTRNARDFVLRLYPRISRPLGPAALGVAGPAGLDPDDPNSEKVETVDLTCEVGRHHNWDSYRQAGSLQARLPFYTLLRSHEASGRDEADGE